VSLARVNDYPVVTDLGWADWPSALINHDPRSGTPSLVVGWSCEQRHFEIREASDQPASLVRFEHQYGGHACRQAMMIGVILPLELSRQHLRNLAELIEVFSIFSSDGSGDQWAARARLAAVVPGLERWWLNGYFEMDDGAKRTWDSALGRWFDAPQVRSGLEALLGFGRTPLEQLTGWNSVAFKLVDERLVGTASGFRNSPECRPS
jgi:hypothetical protein